MLRILFIRFLVIVLVGYVLYLLYRAYAGRLFPRKRTLDEHEHTSYDKDEWEKIKRRMEE